MEKRPVLRLAAQEKRLSQKTFQGSQLWSSIKTIVRKVMTLLLSPLRSQIQFLLITEA
jgi:hypothetical protein